MASVLSLGGPGNPVTTFASNDYEGYEDDSYDDSDDYEASDTEAAYATASLLNDLYAERDQIQNSIEGLQNKQKELEANITGAKNEKEKAIAERDGLAYEISIKTELITALEEKIHLLGEEINLRQIYIKEKQSEIDANYLLLQKRLNAMYMQDDGTMLGLLIGVDSFSEFLTRSEYMVLIAEHDRNLLKELTNQRITIEEEKASLEDAMEQQEQDKVNQEIEWSKNPYNGGVMNWPLPGYSTISSTYGLRFDGNNFHTGMDITSDGSGCFGATIVAAADGVVKLANTTYTEGVGYGIYVMIDHGIDLDGKPVATLYGHCSALLVSLGQEVKRGDPIAQVGSTGWSTGPHLHFEVRINGNSVEPSQYL